MSRKLSLWLGVATLGVATLGFIIFSGRTADTVIDVSQADRPNDAVSVSDGSADKTPASASPDFSLNSSSLRGTEIDGEVLLDPNGRVLLDIGLRRLFDYFLSLVGERDIVQIRAMLKDHLLHKYSPENTNSVLLYFDRYTDYLNALTDLKIGNIAKPEDRLQKVAELRKKILGAEMALAFFAEEEAQAALTLKRMAIAENKNLSTDEKARLLAELDASQNYSARTDAETAAVITEQTRQLDALKLSDAERNAEREVLWGKEAAGRLATLDRERAQWDARVEQYLLERTRIDANRGMSSAARAQAIANLRARQFNDAEQRRIASLEAIGQLKPGG